MYKKVVVPLDGSELAECALEHVKRFFRDDQVEEVILLSVVNTVIPWREFGPGEDGYPVAFDYNAFIKTLMDKSKKYLGKIQSRLSSEGFKVRTESVESTGPSYTIANYAEKNGADLIIMATHGYTGMKRMMMGSTALKVLHESNVPVLFIRPEACRI